MILFLTKISPEHVNLAFLALTMDEIQAQALLFFIAGYDTTANGLCWLMYNLACNPEIQEKVYDEIQEVIGNNVRIELYC